MANLSIATTAAQDAAAQRYVTELNASLKAPGYVPVTALQWVTSLVLDQLNVLVARYADQDRQTKAQLYAKASPADQAAIDAVLAKYAT